LRNSVPNENTVARLISNILPKKDMFGLATPLYLWVEESIH